MRFRCNVCEAIFHDCDQTRSEQRNGQCPSCGYEDIQEIKPLVCPILSMGKPELEYCIHNSCVGWNDYFQMCNVSIPGYLNAREEQREKQDKASITAWAEECAGRYQ